MQKGLWDQYKMRQSKNKYKLLKIKWFRLWELFKFRNHLTGIKVIIKKIETKKRYWKKIKKLVMIIKVKLSKLR